MNTITIRELLKVLLEVPFEERDKPVIVYDKYPTIGVDRNKAVRLLNDVELLKEELRLNLR
jgi:hypothetical protein